MEFLLLTTEAFPIMSYMRMLRSLFITGCVSALAAPVSQPARAQASNSSPGRNLVVANNLRFAGFDYFSHYVLLHVKLNDTLDGRLILDTGGADTEIIPRVARDLNLKVVTVAGDPPYKQTSVSRLTFGGVELKDVICDVDPGLPLKRWDDAHPESKLLGILGIDRLKEWAIGIDFASGTSAWWKDDRAPS
jgi:hypothetical protein